MKKGSILSPYILVKNTQVSFYLFWRKRGGLVVQVSFRSVARFTVVRQTAPLPRGLSAATENDV